MDRLPQRFHLPFWIALSFFLCGAAWAQADGTIANGPPDGAPGLSSASPEIERHVKRLESSHRLYLVRRESPGTTAALRTLEELRKQLGLHRGETGPPRLLYDRHPFQPPREVLLARGSAAALEALRDWQTDRVMEQLGRGTENGFCECYCDEACDNHQFCDGAEHCAPESFSCSSGQAPSCDDVDECTIDSCNETTDQCDNDAVPPPAEVHDLELDLADDAPPVATLAWQSVPGADSYNLYRGEQSDLGDLACYLDGIVDTTTDDDGALPIDEMIVYLVTATHCGESTLGSDFEGDPRPNSAPCP